MIGRGAPDPRVPDTGGPDAGGFDHDGPDPRRGRLRAVVALLVLVEAGVLVAYGLYLGVETVVAEATERGAAAVLAAMTVALGVGLAVAARAVARGRRGARAPVVVWQLLQLAVALPALQQPGPEVRWLVGLPLVVIAVAVTLGVVRSDVLPRV